MAPAKLPVIRGPINTSRTKADLLHIATALSISLPERVTVKILVKSITEFVSANQNKLAKDPKFQLLVAYRPDPHGGGRAETKEKGKNSAERAAEDEVEGAKPHKKPTGAHMKLVETKYTSDPPASFQPLSMVEHHPHGKKGSKYPPQNIGEDEVSSIEWSTPPPVELDEASGNIQSEDNMFSSQATKGPFTPTKPSLSDAMRTIIVRFHDFRNEAKPAEEVFVMEERGLIEHEWLNGKMRDCVKLSSLLPKAIEQSTPIKNCGGRIYRGGVSNSGARVSWATVESILSGDLSQQALLRIIDVYPLVALENEEGCFICDVYLDSDMNISQSAPKPIQASKKKQVQAVELVESDDSASGDEVPVLAVKRGGKSQAGDKMLRFLMRILHAEREELGKLKARATLMRHRLGRFRVVEKATARLEDLGWAKPGGGYSFPDDSEVLPGESFVKSDVLKALELTRTASNNDAKLFNDRLLEQFPDIVKWMKDPDGILSSKFSKMTKAQFDEYREEEERKARKKSDLKRKAHRKDKREFVEGSSRAKRAASTLPDTSSEEEEEEEEVEYVGRKSKKLRRQKSSAGSEDLDG